MEQDPNLTSGQRATFENELAADIVSYATSGTPTYLTAQFAKVQSWARANRAIPARSWWANTGSRNPAIMRSGPAADKPGLVLRPSLGRASRGLCGDGLRCL